LLVCLESLILSAQLHPFIIFEIMELDSAKAILLVGPKRRGIVSVSAKLAKRTATSPKPGKNFPRKNISFFDFTVDCKAQQMTEFGKLSLTIDLIIDAEDTGGWWRSRNAQALSCSSK